MSAPIPLDAIDPARAGFDTAALRRLRTAFERQVEANRLPGAAWLIVRDHAVAAYESVGLPRDAIFRIFSMTKPVTAVAVLRLVEEGRLLLRDPVSAYIPAFEAHPPITLFDLLRHTAGLTYEFLELNDVRRRYTEAGIGRRDRDNAWQAETLASLPLQHPPGTVWEYSRATDVLGRVVEVVSGEPLGVHLHRTLFEPLGMRDTGFRLPADQRHRLAQPLGAPLFDPSEPAAFENAGGGLVSTAADYARFLQMLAQGGKLGSERYLGPRTVAAMTADQLGPLPRTPGILPGGHGFSLGVAVMTAPGQHTEPGSAGAWGWSGAGGTAFFVDPAERMFAIVMTQAPGQLDEVRELFRGLVYAAIDTP